MPNSLLKFAIKTAQKAGKLALSYQKNLQIEEKAKNDLVTNADKASEKLIIAEILKAYPDHAVKGEEATFVYQNNSEPAYRSGRRTARARSEAKNLALPVSSRSELYQIENYSDAEYIWLIDPIDGTTNYAHQMKEFAISIGLFKTFSLEKSKNFQYLSGELIAGVVFAPAMNELFYAAKGQGAYLNDKKIHVTKIPKVSNALFATGFPYQNRHINLPYFSTMMDRCQAIRRLGAASLDLCYVAAGRFDGYWEFDMKPWDIAAGALIVEEAGGTVTDTNGNQIDLFGKDILSSNGKIHKETLNIFAKIKV